MTLLSILGILRKYKKQLLSKWNRRYCVLRDGILLYFQSETDVKGKGYIILGGYKFIIPPNSNGFTFNLESCDKSINYTVSIILCNYNGIACSSCSIEL